MRATSWFPGGACWHDECRRCPARCSSSNPPHRPKQIFLKQWSCSYNSRWKINFFVYCTKRRSWQELSNLHMSLLLFFPLACGTIIYLELRKHSTYIFTCLHVFKYSCSIIYPEFYTFHFVTNMRSLMDNLYFLPVCPTLSSRHRAPGWPAHRTSSASTSS